MNWFKMFTEARNDAKLRSLTDAQHRTWFRLLCYAAEQGNSGRIGPAPAALIALEVAENNLSLLRETCNALQTLQCVRVEKCNADEIEIEFVHFAERQARKPSDEPERIRQRVVKHRVKERAEKQIGKLPVPSSVERNACNALQKNETPHVTPIEEIREEEKRIHTPLPPSRGKDVCADGLEPFEPEPESPQAAWTKEQIHVLDKVSRWWGASNGDRTVGDLLRTYPAALVDEAIDSHHGKVGKAFHPSRLIGLCRAIYDEGRWKPKPRVKGFSSSQPTPAINGAGYVHVARPVDTSPGIPVAKTLAIFKSYSKRGTA